MKKLIVSNVPDDFYWQIRKAAVEAKMTLRAYVLEKLGHPLIRSPHSPQGRKEQPPVSAESRKLMSEKRTEYWRKKKTLDGKPGGVGH